MTTQYVGTWTLPSGNSTDIYWVDGFIEAHWDHAPDDTWPDEDVAYWRRVTFPAVILALQRLTGQRILGVSL